MLKKLIYISCLVFVASNASANENLNYSCELVSGKIVKAPRNPLFKFTKSKKNSKDNYPMTHTQFFIQSDNGKTYKVIVDNLFYKYTSPQQASSNEDVGVISDFSSRYKVGDNVSACGKIINKDNKLAIHFVHPSNCNATQFNGFLKINGQQLTNNNQYCYECSCK